mmetsp:Transcript_32776/g.84653  ORF Transcript_32776/g.84653 Transcript_32776/m.84653 type:complete len:352 (-) Transcript_32776:540-1595(-)
MAEVDLKPLLEVVEMLRDQRPAVKGQAVDIFLAYSTQPGLYDVLKESKAIVYLLHLFYDKELGHKALSTIVNMSTTEACATALIKFGAVERALDVINKGESSAEAVEKATMLLVNLSTTEEGAKAIAPTDINSPKSAKLSQAVQKYVEVPAGKRDDEDNLRYLSHVLSNITQVESGRKLLMNEDLRILPRLMPELFRKSEERRKGIAGAVKNCCFDADYHEQLLNDVDFMSQLLLPLVASDFGIREEEVDKLLPLIKERWETAGSDVDISADVRLSLLESIALLTSGRLGRDKMREMGVYPILRELDLQEEDSDCKDVILTVVERLVILEEEEASDAPQLEAPKIEELAME